MGQKITRGRGRPHLFNDYRALAVARRLAAGDSLREAAAAAKFPTASVVGWVEESERFRRLLYAAAWISVVPALHDGLGQKPDRELRRDFVEVEGALADGDVDFLVCCFADTEKNAAMLKVAFEKGTTWMVRNFIAHWTAFDHMPDWKRDLYVKQAREKGWSIDVMIRVLTGGASITHREWARLKKALVPPNDDEDDCEGYSSGYSPWSYEMERDFGRGKRARGGEVKYPDGFRKASPYWDRMMLWRKPRIRKSNRVRR